MFTPIHLVPQYDRDAAERYQGRWETHDGQALRDKVLGMIRQGAGEDFLQWEFEHGGLGFLESMADLKGLKIFNEDITFPDGDSFEGIDFSYSEFYHSKFRNAAFISAFRFSRIYNCEFINCVFAFNGFYGTTLEKVKFINCDFFEQNSFTNCQLLDVQFQGCFIPENIFFDCRFDESTAVNELAPKPIRMTASGLVLEKSHRAGIYKGIKEAYTAGGAVAKAREYFFKQMKAVTRYNTQGFWRKAWSYFFEYVAGYGVKPHRVLFTMCVVYLLSLLVFLQRYGLSDALLLTAGAFFTFGASSDLVREGPAFWQVFYVATSFLGISLTALFVTVLANVWLRER